MIIKPKSYRVDFDALKPLVTICIKPTFHEKISSKPNQIYILDSFSSNVWLNHLVLSPVWILLNSKIYYWVTVLLKNIVRFLLKHHLAFRITYKSKIVCLGVKCLRKMIFFIRDLTMVKFLLNPSEWNTKRRKSYAQVKKDRLVPIQNSAWGDKLRVCALLWPINAYWGFMLHKLEERKLEHHHLKIV